MKPLGHKWWLLKVKVDLYLSNIFQATYCYPKTQTKQTEMSEFRAEKDVLQGPCKENREAHAQKTQPP